jgi:hypothetical protein
VEDPDVLALCCPLAMTTLKYKRLKAYGNHYQVNSCPTIGIVSYDCGVAFIFNQQQMQVRDEDVAIKYVGVLKDIPFKLWSNFKFSSSYGEWVRNGTNIRGNPTY